MRAYLSLLRDNVAFRRVWLSSVLSQLGDWMSYLALARFALAEGGGPLGVAGIFIAHSLPYALLAPLGGVLADALDRRSLLVWTPLAQGVLTLLMLPAAGLGAGWVGALVFLRAALVALYEPAETAALRRLVPPEELARAFSLNGASWSVMFALGMALGGLLADLGLWVALLVDAATFAASAALLRGVPAMPPSAEAPRGALSTVPRELAAAWRYAGQTPPLREALLAKARLGVGAGAVLLAMNLKADSLAALGAGGTALGLMQAVKGLGTGLGPLLSARVARGGAEALLTRAASWLALVGMAWLLLSHGALGALGASLVWGMGSGANWMFSTVSLQRLAPDHLAGRLAALDGVALTLAQCASALLAAHVEIARPGWGGWLGIGLCIVVLGWPRTLRQVRYSTSHPS